MTRSVALAYDVPSVAPSPRRDLHARAVTVMGATEKAGDVGRTILWYLTGDPSVATVFAADPDLPKVSELETAKAHGVASPRPRRGGPPGGPGQATSMT